MLLECSWTNPITLVRRVQHACGTSSQVRTYQVQRNGCFHNRSRSLLSVMIRDDMEDLAKLVNP